MAQSPAINAPHRSGFLATLRLDAWWLEPGLTAVGLAVFFGWLTVSIFLDGWHWEIGPYLSPVYEPKVHDEFAAPWLSPAMLIIWGPVGFRATCYYYRNSYYRSWFLSPPACAVGDALPKYTGESRIPFIIQNVHRFFMYVALVFVPILWIGAIRGFHHPDEGWGIGLGSIILCANAFLLMMYTFGCHSLRHFVGGGLNCFSQNAVTRTRKWLWDWVTAFNSQHRLWAWSSLIGVAVTDVYIRLVANGHITDPNTWSSF